MREQAREIGVFFWHRGNALDIRRVFETRKNGRRHLGLRHAFFSIAAGLIARPEADMLHAILRFHAKENNRVPSLLFSDIRGPEDLHEITRPCLLPGGEVFSQTEFMEEARGAGTVGVPTSPDADPIGHGFG